MKILAEVWAKPTEIPQSFQNSGQVKKLCVSLKQRNFIYTVTSVT